MASVLQGKEQEQEHKQEQRGVVDHDRVRGVLLGLACGDALGTSSEFMRRGTFPEIKDMVGGGVMKLQPGQWTDDTSLALCLSQSLIEREGHDPRDQLQRYLEWYDDGKLSSTGTCFDIGNTTRGALERFRESDCTRTYCGSTLPKAAGNGSLMRLAPVPMLLRLHPGLAVAVAGESSKTTHASQTTVDACRYFAGLVVGAIDGAPKERLLAAGGFVPAGLPKDYWSTLEPPLHVEVAEVVLGATHASRAPPGEEEQKRLNGWMLSIQKRKAILEGAIQNDGYVVRTLEAALWAFGRSSDFKEGCLMIANLGADADTVAAVYGQLAGAFYGASGIPPEWRAKLALGGLIESMADELFSMSNRVHSGPGTEPTLGSPRSKPAAVPCGSYSSGLVTRFTVNPAAADEKEKQAYWGGGVAARYQVLEDRYRAITLNTYNSIEDFDRDVLAMLHEDPPGTRSSKPSASATGNNVDVEEATTVFDCESQTVKDGTPGDTAARRRLALTEEFAARVAHERVKLVQLMQMRQLRSSADSEGGTSKA